MANPDVVEVPKGAWLPVAINVLTGFVHILKFDSMYRQTYRLTGEAAPLLADEGEGAEMDRPGAPISSSVGIDVYLFCTATDGKVRVDV